MRDRVHSIIWQNLEKVIRRYYMQRRIPFSTRSGNTGLSIMMAKEEIEMAYNLSRTINTGGKRYVKKRKK